MVPAGEPGGRVRDAEPAARLRRGAAGRGDGADARRGGGGAGRGGRAAVP